MPSVVEIQRPIFLTSTQRVSEAGLQDHILKNTGLMLYGQYYIVNAKPGTTWVYNKY